MALFVTTDERRTLEAGARSARPSLPPRGFPASLAGLSTAGGCARLLEADPGVPKREPTTAVERPGDDAQHPLRCRACERVITFASSRVEPDGRHVHMRLNPAAVAFIFGCFGEAPGAVVVGEPTGEATWFSGCRWQYAHCAGCFTHLGWYFSGTATFFGLVLERLVGP